MVDVNNYRLQEAVPRMQLIVFMIYVGVWDCIHIITVIIKYTM